MRLPSSKSSRPPSGLIKPASPRLSGNINTSIRNDLAKDIGDIIKTETPDFTRVYKHMGVMMPIELRRGIAEPIKPDLPKGIDDDKEKKVDSIESPMIPLDTHAPTAIPPRKHHSARPEPRGKMILAQGLDKQAIEVWWMGLLAQTGQDYPIYAFLLLVPSNEAAATYMTKYGHELHDISGDDCLFITITDSTFFAKPNDALVEKWWQTTFPRNLNQGYSVELARYFKIPLADLPCIVFFDKLPPKHKVKVSLDNLTVEQISDRIRTLFDDIHQLVEDGTDVLAGIQAKYG